LKVLGNELYLYGCEIWMEDEESDSEESGAYCVYVSIYELTEDKV